MGRNVLTVMMAAALLFAIIVAGAALVVMTGAGASLPIFSACNACGVAWKSYGDRSTLSRPRTAMAWV